MKNVTKFGLTTLACLMLAACGSSGGGSNATEVTAKDPTTNTTISSRDGETDQVNKGYQEKGSETVFSNKTGTIAVYKERGENISVSYIPQTNGLIGEIEVEGKKVPIIYPDRYT